MIIKNKQKKEIQHEVFKTLHNLHFRKVKFPKFLDEYKELSDKEELSFGAKRQEIFQDGEDGINEQDATAYLNIHKN